MIAHGTPDGAAFRVEVQRLGRTNAGVRGRLVHLDALVQAACEEAGIGLDAEVDDLT
jgi:hypothetical protein